MSTMTETFDPNVDQTRTFQARAEAVTERREISGVGVPLEDRIQIYPGLYEEFAQDCDFEGIDRAKLRIDHGVLAGVLAGHARSKGKLNVTLRASKVPAGDDALVLATDGALDSFSIGFRAKDYEQIDNEDGSMTIRHTRVQVREFSLTATPYYPNATVTEVRSLDRQKENTMSVTSNPETSAQFEELRSEFEARFDSVEEMQRSFAALVSRLSDDAEPGPKVDTRSAAAFVKALAANDKDAIETYNRSQEHKYDEMQHRAYTGGTSADAPVKDGWVGDLTRIFDSSSGVLSDFFSTGTLPKEGNNIEYAELLSNTVQVTEQAAEGDDLAYGKVTLTTKTAPVKTYGGYIQLTRQAIERSTLPVLNRSLEALSKAAGARKKAVLRSEYGTLVAAREAIPSNGGVVVLGATLAASTAQHWLNAIVDSAVRFDGLDLSLDGMIASASVFKKLNSLETTGHRVFEVISKAEDGRHVGYLDLTALKGDLAGVLVLCDPGQTADHAAMANKEALRQYDSALVSLQDENVINLSKDFSVYRYGAVAAEIPQGVVPVKLAAA